VLCRSVTNSPLRQGPACGWLPPFPAPRSTHAGRAAPAQVELNELANSHMTTPPNRHQLVHPARILRTARPSTPPTLCRSTTRGLTDTGWLPCRPLLCMCCPKGMPHDLGQRDYTLDPYYRGSRFPGDSAEAVQPQELQRHHPCLSPERASLCRFWSVDARRRVDPLPDQAGHLLLARQQQRAGAEGQPLHGKLDPPLLVAADPVGKQRQLHMMDDAVAMQGVPARMAPLPAAGPALFAGPAILRGQPLGRLGALVEAIHAVRRARPSRRTTSTSPGYGSGGWGVQLGCPLVGACRWCYDARGACAVAEQRRVKASDSTRARKRRQEVGS
jgi:hypothetical protein